MDETESVDYQLSCGKGFQALAEMTVRMEMSTDGNRNEASDMLANCMVPVDKEGQEVVTVVSVGRRL
jgi:hypothetical protein